VPASRLQVAGNLVEYRYSFEVCDFVYDSGASVGIGVEAGVAVAICVGCGVDDAGGLMSGSIAVGLVVGGRRVAADAVGAVVADTVDNGGEGWGGGAVVQAVTTTHTRNMDIGRIFVGTDGLPRQAWRALNARVTHIDPRQDAHRSTAAWQSSCRPAFDPAACPRRSVVVMGHRDVWQPTI